MEKKLKTIAEIVNALSGMDGEKLMFILAMATVGVAGLAVYSIASVIKKDR